MTVTVPQPLLPRVSAENTEWLVRGRLEEKIVALIRSLPKSIRRAVVPAPDVAREAAARILLSLAESR